MALRSSLRTPAQPKTRWTSGLVSKEVLSEHETKVLSRVLAQEEEQRQHIVVALSGAHAYGFPSPDSDLDLKAIHIAPTRQLLGLRPHATSAERMEFVEGVEIDYSSNELGGVLHGVLKGNGNYIERILGEHLVARSAQLDELQDLVADSCSRLSHRHYQGFAMQQRKSVESSSEPTIKKLLYVLRTALTGLHLLKSGELVVDLRRNASEYGYEEALELIEAKRQGEQQQLSEAHKSLWLGRLDALFEHLDSVLESSVLPARAPNEDALEDFLIRARLEQVT